MKLRLGLLRHGETEQGGGLRGRIDDELTPLGWQQMQQALADDLGWTRLVSSPLRRCAAFAERLAAEGGLPLQLAAGLRELDFGDWDGRSAAELMQTQSRELGLFWEDPYAFTPPAGEPLVAFEARVLDAVRQLAGQWPAERALLVCHGGVIRLLLARARGLPRARLLQVEVGHGQLCLLDAWLEGDALNLEEPA